MDLDGLNLGAKLELEEGVESEEEITESELGEDLSYDELFRTCQDKKNQLLECRQQIAVMTQDLKDEKELREDAEASNFFISCFFKCILINVCEFYHDLGEETWREKFTEANNRREVLEIKSVLDMETKRMQREDRDMYHHLYRDMERKYRKKCARVDKQLENIYNMKTTDNKQFDTLQMALHWHAVAKTDATLRNSAQELFVVRQELDDLKELKAKDDEKMEQMTTAYLRLKEKCQAEAKKKLVQFSNAPFGGPADFNEDTGKMEWLNDDFTTMQNAFRNWRKEMPMARMEGLMLRYKAENDRLVAEQDVLKEEIRTRDVFISKLQGEIENLKFQCEDLYAYRERQWMYQEEITDLQNLLKPRLAHVEQAQLYERGVAQQNYDNMNDEFDRERGELKRDIKSLEEILEEAKRMGNDPYTAARVRVVPRGEGVICTKCMGQVLKRQVKQLEDHVSTNDIKDKPQLVRKATNHFFSREFADLVRPDDHDLVNFQLEGYDLPKSKKPKFKFTHTSSMISKFDFNLVDLILSSGTCKMLCLIGQSGRVSSSSHRTQAIR